MRYGRRRSDGLVQALLWVQVLALAVLWGVNLLYIAKLGEALSGSKAAAASMRAEVGATRKERRAFTKAALAFLEGMRMLERPKDDIPGGNL